MTTGIDFVCTGSLLTKNITKIKEQSKVLHQKEFMYIELGYSYNIF